MRFNSFEALTRPARVRDRRQEDHALRALLRHLLARQRGSQKEAGDLSTEDDVARLSGAPVPLLTEVDEMNGQPRVEPPTAQPLRFHEPSPLPGTVLDWSRDGEEPFTPVPGWARPPTPLDVEEPGSTPAGRHSPSGVDAPPDRLPYRRPDADVARVETPLIDPQAGAPQGYRPPSGIDITGVGTSPWGAWPRQDDESAPWPMRHRVARDPAPAAVDSAPRARTGSAPPQLSIDPPAPGVGFGYPAEEARIRLAQYTGAPTMEGVPHASGSPAPLTPRHMPGVPPAAQPMPQAVPQPRIIPRLGLRWPLLPLAEQLRHPSYDVLPAGELPPGSLFTGATSPVYRPPGVMHDWRRVRAPEGTVPVLELRGLEWNPAHGVSKPVVGTLPVQRTENVCPDWPDVTMEAIRVDQLVRGLAANSSLPARELGTEIHTALANEVRLWGPNYRAEQYVDNSGKRSFLDILSLAPNNAICIYDIKTGESDMSGRQMHQYYAAAQAFAATRKFAPSAIYVIPVRTKY